MTTMDTKTLTNTCPFCGTSGALQEVRELETITIKGEPFEVNGLTHRCTVCNESVSADEEDAFELAKAQYRLRHSIFSGEELRSFRNHYGLNQVELASILGWGVASISRYENGTLPESSHNILFMAVKSSPSALNKLLDREDIPANVAAKIRVKLMPEVHKELNERSLEMYATAAPGETLNLAKLKALVIYLCEAKSVFKTKLNKLMFYADFKAKKELGHSISGCLYLKHQFGPVPAQYDNLFQTLVNLDAITSEEVQFPEGKSGTQYSAVNKADRNLFDDRELEILRQVVEFFDPMTAQAISDKSHEERAWVETQAGGAISYEFAMSLSI